MVAIIITEFQPLYYFVNAKAALSIWVSRYLLKPFTLLQAIESARLSLVLYFYTFDNNNNNIFSLFFPIIALNRLNRLKQAKTRQSVSVPAVLAAEGQAA